MEIIGQFMYPKNAHKRLVNLARVHPLAALQEAIEAATQATSFECIVMRHEE
jgi:hypothetical protein